MSNAKPYSCAKTRGLLQAYAQNELPSDISSAVGAHLDKCDSCYRSYQASRDVTRELTQSLPAIGRLDASHMSHMWNLVQAGMLTRQRPSPLQREPARLGIAALILISALTLTVMIRYQRITLSLPLPPTPVILVQETENIVTHSATVVASVPLSFAAATAAVTPPAGPNYAPPLDPGVTDTP